MPGSEVANQIVRLEDVAPSLAALAEPIAESRSWRDRLDLVDRELTTLAEERPQPDPLVERMWKHLHQSAGAMRISQLGAPGLSQRSMTRRFISQVGLTPKAAARILRFEHAAAMLTTKSPAADAAARAGYYDQSHLIREFRALAGQTPAAFAASAPPTPRKALGLV